MMMLVVNGDDGDGHSHCHDGDDGSVIVTLSFSSFSQAYRMPQVNFSKEISPFSLLFPSFYLLEEGI